MLSVLNGFAVVVLIIALGYAVQRRQLLGPNAVYALNMFVYWIALPATLIHFLSRTNISALFQVPLAVVAMSTLATAALGFFGYRLALRWRRGSAPNVGDSVVAMLACTYCNGSNLGIPLATHLLDDATATLPVILFQVGFFGPLAVLILDMQERARKADAAQEQGVRRISRRAPVGFVRSTIMTIFKNPLILASSTGVVLSLARHRWGFELPLVLAEPVEILSGATVGAALIAFGMSLARFQVLRRGVSPIRSVVAASLVKTIIHPLLAVGIGYGVFGASGTALLTIALIAGLPAGQNVFTYAQRFGVNEVLARDTAAVSTVISIPTLLLIMVLLG